MSVLIIAAAIVTGLVLGWWLTVTVAAAAISHSQARMQRKVRYWQAQARRAQAQEQQLAHSGLEQLVGPEQR